MKSNATKSMLTLFLALACLAMTTTFALAAETTITGVGKCAKDHQTAVQVEEDGKTVTYYLTENEVSKDFHSKICSKEAKIKVTGEVKKVGGRMQMTASKIELLTLAEAN